MQMKLLSCHGLIVKNLIDIIYQNFKNDICLEFRPKGVYCEQLSANSERMVKFELWENNQIQYPGDKIYLIGVQLRQLVEILKSVRKFDSVKLTIDPDAQKLFITIKNDDQQRQISNSIPFFEIQQIKIDPIDAPYKSLTLSAGEFSKFVKEINLLTTDVLVQIFSDVKTLRVVSRSCNIAEKIITLGPDPEGNPNFEAIFPFDFLNHLNRLTYITHYVKINYAQDFPLKISCNINDRGEFEYFVNPKNA